MRGALSHDSGIQECLREVARSPYPLGEEAVVLSQRPTGGEGWASLRRNAWPLLACWVAWLVGPGVGANGGLVPGGEGYTATPGAPGGYGGREASVGGGYGCGDGGPDVQGARARVAALGAGDPMPESLWLPEEAPADTYAPDDIKAHRLVAFAVEVFGDGLGEQVKLLL
ncbi:hypothetical protein CYMTET_34216 [Cymbomonas tetramitiformis]|uniref:Uncharacterized protein n=1 Tax=Cymbomonas tetramitiformis TaxID=36881 RepID=A0AAE0FC33_9CHLO|nr:hypothetical protein CYMTET_34216 [Cymbomonas tetramitiformis]